VSRRSAVVDASAALALIRGEHEADGVNRTLRVWLAQGRDLFVPSLFWLELLNILGRDHGRGGAALLETLRMLDAVGLQTIETDGALRLQALDLMERFGLTAYDAAYAAVAEFVDGDLVTLDEALLRALPGRAMRPDDVPRSSEQRSPYEHEVRWTTHPHAGRIVAALRDT
jgi:predicted nucleic acid-binding protein